MIDSKPYTGRGKQLTAEEQRERSIDSTNLTDPQFYVAPPSLAAAVNVARALDMPLLLTGEPGCGKSQLAHSVAWELKLGEPLTFTVKSDSQGRDLFYSYDTLGRFRAKNDDDPYRFLRLSALGRAIWRALGKNAVLKEDEKLETCIDDEKLRFDLPGSVVLIDEIDKAPREVPNDILNEINELGFDIPELPVCPQFALKKPKQDSVDTAKSAQHQDDKPVSKPIVIITSNRERELPEAFLRRCVYYHVKPLPFRKTAKNNQNDHAVTIEDIIKQRLDIDIAASEGTDPNSEKNVWAGGVSLFAYLQNARLQKAPSTAELLSWLLWLRQRYGLDLHKQVKDTGDFLPSARITLFKHMEDQSRADDLFAKWCASNS